MTPFEIAFWSALGWLAALLVVCALTVGLAGLLWLGTQGLREAADWIGAVVTVLRRRRA